ncbi:glycosyltransferase [Pantoea sp.]|uniref:glycosyltransferase n=1 Tax=Pantoea sp. TaxID=69393 RepID=UPI0028AA43F0|nr:glycosyltransferase [Pantoea sp.]
MKIAALIVTYNRLDKLKKCWAAIEPLSFHEIIIVNNASTDATGEWLNELQDSRLRVISNDVNEGGAGGFYKGSEWLAKNSTPDWVLFFDDDAYPEPDILKKFMTSHNDNAQVVVTNVVDMKGSRCKMNIPWLKIPNSLGDIISYYNEPSRYEAHPSQVSEVVTFSFVGVFINFNVLKRHYHKINKDLFIYFDDVYFSWELHLNDCKIIFNPELNFYHDILESNSAMLPWKVYYLSRNLILSRFLFKKNRPFSLISIMLRLVKCYFMVVKSDNKLSYVKYLTKGIFDGISFRLKESKNGRV